MRYVLAAVFVVFFISSLACGILLSLPPTSVYEFRNFIMVLAGGLLFLAAVLLVMLVFGFGSKGKKRSLWRLPILCLLATLLGLVFGVAIFAAKMENPTPQHSALNLRLTIYAAMMIVFALFSGLCLLLSYILAKKHNSKLPPPAS